jgi:hypothetical protein
VMLLHRQMALPKTFSTLALSGLQGNVLVYDGRRIEFSVLRGGELATAGRHYTVSRAGVAYLLPGIPKAEMPAPSPRSSEPPVVTESLPDPIPATVPDPIPATVPATVPDPVPDPVPATVPDPVPATVPDPVPATVPDPVPATVPDPVPDPVPVPGPTPTDVPRSLPEESRKPLTYYHTAASVFTRDRRGQVVTRRRVIEGTRVRVPVETRGTLEYAVAILHERIGRRRGRGHTRRVLLRGGSAIADATEAGRLARTMLSTGRTRSDCLWLVEEGYGYADFVLQSTAPPRAVCAAYQ